MLEDKRQQILKQLQAGEEAENNLLALYDSLLNLGVVNCLTLEKQRDFTEALQAVNNESKRHQELIAGLIQKYK